jgi:hypothetical protein
MFIYNVQLGTYGKKGKVIPVQAVEALRVTRDWGSHIFRHSAHMAARLSALRVGRFLPQGTFLVLNSVRGWVEPRVILRLEGLGKLKKSTSSGTRTGDLPACSIVPQPTTLPHGIKVEEMSPHVLGFAVKIYAYKIRKCLDVPIFQESGICKTISLHPRHSYVMCAVPTLLPSD